MVHYRCFRYQDASALLRSVIDSDTNPTTTQTSTVGQEAASILTLVYRHLGRDKGGVTLVDNMLAQTKLSPESFSAAHVLTLQYRRALILRQSGH